MAEIGKGGHEEVNAILTKLADEKVKAQRYSGSQHDLEPIYDNRAVIFLLGTVAIYVQLLCRGSEGVLSRGFFVWLSESLISSRKSYRFDDKEDSVDVDNGNVQRRFAVTHKEKQKRGIAYYNTCKNNRDKAIRYCAYLLFYLYTEYRMIWAPDDKKRKGKFKYSPGAQFRVLRSNLKRHRAKWMKEYGDTGATYQLPLTFVDQSGDILESIKTGGDAFIESDKFVKNARKNKQFNATASCLLNRAARLVHNVGLGMHFRSITVESTINP